MATFINKDSTSSNVARSTPSERRLINEQSREHRASARTILARTNARKRHRPSESRPQPRPDHVSGQATSIDSNASDDSDTTKTYSAQLILAPSPPMDTTKSSLEPTAFRTSNILTDGSPTRPTPAPIPLGNPIDPFQSTIAPLTSTTLHLLRYYKIIYYTTLWSTIHETLTSYMPDPTTLPYCTADQVIYEALQNRTRMSCLLANAGSHMTLYTNTNATSLSQNPSAEVTNLSLLQRGTSSLRHEMVSKSLHPDNDILMSAMHLYFAATRMGRDDAATAHLKGVRAIVEGILGGGDELSSASLGVLALVDEELAVRLLNGSHWGNNDGRRQGVSVVEVS